MLSFYWFGRCFLRVLWALALFTYLRFLEFGDGDYVWNRLFDHFGGEDFDSRGNTALRRPLPFTRYLSRLSVLRLSFAKRFLGVAFAAVRFADLLRVDLEALRTLPRAVDLLFLAVARFFRCAMIATYQHEYCGSVIKRQ